MSTSRIPAYVTEMVMMQQLLTGILETLRFHILLIPTWILLYQPSHLIHDSEAY
jgi:hypothetical protein